jgi:hypothetical protein
MDKNGMFGELLETGQHAAQNTVKSVADSVTGQLGFDKGEASPDNQGKVQAQGQQGNAQNQKQPATEAIPQAASSEDTKKFVEEFYAPSTELPENLTPELSQQMQQKDKMETQQKLANLRQELHKSGYYEQLTSYEEKKPEEEGEENAAERVEKQEKEEEQKKMELEEKKAKEDQDIAKTRAQTKTEANRGVAG